MTHGDREAERRHRDYQRSELMSLGERLREVEEKLNAANRHLARLERQLTGQDASVQSGANALTEG